MSVRCVAVRVTAGRCSVVERRLFTFRVLGCLVSTAWPSVVGVGVEPRGGWVVGVWAHCWVLRDRACRALLLLFVVVVAWWGWLLWFPGLVSAACGVVGGGFPVVV